MNELREVIRVIDELIDSGETRADVALAIVKDTAKQLQKKN